MLDLLRLFSPEADPAVPTSRVSPDVPAAGGVWVQLGELWGALGAAWLHMQHQGGVGGQVAADRWQQKAPNALQRLFQGQRAAYCHLNLQWRQSQEQGGPFL